MVENEIDIAQWNEAFQLWFGQLRTESTRSIYKRSWESLEEHSGKSLWEIHKTDIVRWLGWMKEQGLAAQTMNQRLAAVGSFFAFAGSVYTVENEDGEEIPLAASNPVRSIARPKRQLWANTYFLSAEECQALLAAVDQTSIVGKRNYAMILGYLIMGRRNSELRKLKWEDLTRQDQRIWYTWGGKGKSGERFEMPAAVYEAIEAYLQAAGRLETIQPEDYIFISTLRADAAKPLSIREANRMLKVYARIAGLDPVRIHIHSLRHSAAMLRMQAGDDVGTISAFLAHNNITTTSIYLHKVRGRPDNSAGKVGRLLGL